MRNYIILNNKSSNDINGLIIQELAPISKPQQRTQVETIDGRDGDIVTPLGYAAYNKKIKIGLYGTFDINEIIAYFATQGTAIFSNEPDKYYNYQILDQIDYERLVRYRVATVTMHVQPFKYSATEGTITVDASDTVSGEGSDIALDGTAEAPFNVLRHKGNATQKTYTGKNLLPVPSPYINTGIKSYNIALPAGTYTLSFAGATTTGSGHASYFRVYDDQNTDLATRTVDFSIPNKWTFTIASPATKFAIYSQNTYVGSSGVTTTFTDIQLEAGSAKSDYEPYVGGIPSPNPDYPQDIQVLTGDSTVKITGKNLFKGGNADYTGSQAWQSYGNSAYTLADGAYTMPDRFGAIAFEYDNLTAGQQYTISFDVIASAQTNVRVGINRYNNAPIVGDQYQFTAKTQSQRINWTFTATEQNRIAFNSGVTAGISVTFSNIQLELGSTATAYEPYKGQSYVIPFGDTYLAAIGDYADEPVKVGDTWYIRRAIGKAVLDGTETWTLNENGTGYARFTTVLSDIITSFSNSQKYVISDNFTSSTQAETVNALADANRVCVVTNGRILFKTLDAAIDTAAKWQTWLGTHNTTVYYVLATPTDEEITDQDLIDALDDFYGQAHSYKGRTHLTATPQGDNAPAILAVEVGENNESTVTNAGNTTSRPILTIYGQGDIGMYINDVQVLDIALGDEQYITIDSVAMEAYKDTTANLKNRLVTGDYSKLALNAGDNKIYFTGNVTKYEISKYSRWL